MKIRTLLFLEYCGQCSGLGVDWTTYSLNPRRDKMFSLQNIQTGSGVDITF